MNNSRNLDEKTMLGLGDGRFDVQETSFPNLILQQLVSSLHAISLLENTHSSQTHVIPELNFI